MGARGIGSKPITKRKPGQQPRERAGTPIPGQPDIPDLHPRYKGRKEPPASGGLFERLQDDSQNLWSDLQDAAYVAKYEPAPNVKVVGQAAMPGWSQPELTRSERVIDFCADADGDVGVGGGQVAGAAAVAKRVHPRGVSREGWRPPDPHRCAKSWGGKTAKRNSLHALALCHLLGPECESRGEVYSCANDRFQAGKIFHEMVALINAHPKLRRAGEHSAFPEDHRGPRQWVDLLRAFRRSQDQDGIIALVRGLR